MLALWHAADKFDVLFGCCFMALFFAVGFIYVTITKDQGLQVIVNNEARDALEKKNQELLKRLARLNHKYNLLNGIMMRVCDQVYGLTGVRLIKQHRSGDCQQVNPLFDSDKQEGVK